MHLLYEIHENFVWSSWNDEIPVYICTYIAFFGWSCPSLLWFNTKLLCYTSPNFPFSSDSQLLMGLVPSYAPLADHRMEMKNKKKKHLKEMSLDNSSSKFILTQTPIPLSVSSFYPPSPAHARCVPSQERILPPPSPQNYKIESHCLTSQHPPAPFW